MYSLFHFAVDGRRRVTKNIFCFTFTFWVAYALSVVLRSSAQIPIPTNKIKNGSELQNFTVKECNASYGRYYQIDESFNSHEYHFGNFYNDFQQNLTNKFPYCPEGYACVDNLCAPCLLGKYCPAGTVQPDAYVLHNLCPAGRYCETPLISKPCPKGYACGIATVKLNVGFSKRCVEMGGGKVGGMYCPKGSKIGARLAYDFQCPAGYYCPENQNFTLKKLCPKNNYCYARSKQPLECGKGNIFGFDTHLQTSQCPPGSSKPSVDFIGVVQTCVLSMFVLVITSAILICIKFFRFTQQRSLKRAVLRKATKDFIYSISDKTSRLKKDYSSKTKHRDTPLSGKSIELTDEALNMGSKNDSFKVKRSLSRKQPDVDAAALIFEVLATRHGDAHKVSKESVKKYFTSEMRKSEARKYSLAETINASDRDTKFNASLTSTWNKFDVDQSGTLGLDGFKMWYNQLIKRSDESSDIAQNNYNGSADIKGFRKKTMKERFAFRFDNLGLDLNMNGKTVLKGVSGEFSHSQLIAIMGPSGAGKSTFLNTICGRAFYGTATGTVYINGKVDSIQNHRDVVGFVPQDDIVFETLTVYENFMFASHLRQPQKSQEEHYLIIEDVIRLLELDHVRSVVVGSVDKRGISGGQRKRVNIGLELVADPNVLFLDEPTSGLDATSAKIVMSALKDLANLGMTVIAVIHQPRYSIFALFDQLLLLGKGGATVYNGPTLYAEAYFSEIGFKCPETENVADFLLDVCAGVVIRENDPSFVPGDLFDTWNSGGLKTISLLRGDENHGKRVRSVSRVNADVLKLATQTIKPKDMALFMRGCKTFMLLSPKNDVMNKDDLYDVLSLMDVSHKTQMEFIKFIELFQQKNDVDMPLLTIENALQNFVTKSNIKLQGARSRQRTVILRENRRNDVSTSANGKRNRNTGNSKKLLRSRANTWEVMNPTISQKSGKAQGILLMLRPVTFLFNALKSFKNQYWLLQYRSLLIRFKSWKMILFDVIAGLAAGLFAGSFNVSDSFSYYMYPTTLTLAFALLGVLTGVGSVDTFGSTKLLYYRERSWGLNALAYCVSKMLLDLVLLLLKSSIFGVVFYDVARPLVSRSQCITVCVCVAFAAGAWGYVFSILFSKHAAQIIAAVGCFVIGATTSGLKPTFKEIEGAPVTQAVFNISYGRWGVEGLLSEWVINSPEPYPRIASDYLANKGYRISKGVLVQNCLNLLYIGVFLRFVSYLLLVWVDRNKQNKVCFPATWCKCIQRKGLRMNDRSKKLNMLKYALATRNRLKNVSVKRFAFNIFRDQEWLNRNNKRNSIIDEVYFSKYDAETKKYSVGIEVKP